MGIPRELPSSMVEQAVGKTIVARQNFNGRHI